MSERGEAVAQSIIDTWQVGGFEAAVVNGLASCAKELCRIADHLSGESGESEAGAGVPVEDRENSTAPAPRPPHAFKMRSGKIHVVNPNGDSAGNRLVLLHPHGGTWVEWANARSEGYPPVFVSKQNEQVEAPREATKGRTWTDIHPRPSEWFDLPPIPGAS